MFFRMVAGVSGLTAVLLAGSALVADAPSATSRVATASAPTVPYPPVSTRPVSILRFPAPRAPASRPAAGATEAVYQAALEWFDRAIPYVDEMVPAAEVVADRFIGGGDLYATGNAGFADELVVRAGGFPFALAWNGQKLTGWDVVVAGKFRPNEPEMLYGRLDGLLRSGRLNSSAVVCFASRNWPQFERLLPGVDKRSWGDRLHIIDTGAPEGASLADLNLGQMATTALAWAFQGEVMAAATRRGKTLATYASDWEPNGAAWDATVRGQHLHPRYTVPPIPAGKIGKEYLAICRRQVERFLATGQPDRVRQAARRLVECVATGGVLWVVADGHIHPRGALVPADLPRVRMVGRSYEWGRSRDLIAPGDLLLYLGYLRYPNWAVDSALAAKCQAVVVCVDEGRKDDRVTHVGSCFANWDSTVDLPGYPIRVLPSSGVVQTPQWYSLMAETLAARSPRPAAAQP